MANYRAKTVNRIVTKTQNDEQSKKHFFLIFCLSLGLLLTALPAFSDQPLSLNQELQAHLYDLDGLAANEDSIAAERTANSISDQAFEGKITVVTFFASWCPPCLHEFKALNEIQSELGTDDVSVIAVNVFEQFDNTDDIRMVKFLNKTKPDFSVVSGTDESRQLFGNINRIPTLLIFDKSGKLAFDFVHARGAKKQSVDSEELLEAIRPLL